MVCTRRTYTMKENGGKKPRVMYRFNAINAISLVRRLLLLLLLYIDQ